MNIVDGLNGIWTQILDIASVFILPDWGGLIGLLPILIFLGVVGPLVTILLLGTLVYQARKPRVKIAFEEGPRMAEIDATGEPIFPPGLPHCRRDGLIYPSGALRCERCQDDLAVICPMCGLGRTALIDTCSNCGLVLKVKQRAVAVRTSAGPRPGGAAVA
ncbi:MAG: hypothetical protein WKF56_08570 [Candidatus Limnocylindrales bacterium]